MVPSAKVCKVLLRTLNLLGGAVFHCDVWGLVWVAKGRLEHHFNHHGTDGKTKAFTGCRELVNLQ